MNTTLDSPKTLVLGLGNPILGDDAVGLHVVRRAEAEAGPLAEGVAFRERCIGGMDLLFEIEGFDRLVVVDAFVRTGTQPGRVRVLSSEEIGLAGFDGVQDHWLDLPTAIELGRQIGCATPEQVCAVVIDVGDEAFVFGEQMTDAVERAVPEAVARVLRILSDDTQTKRRHSASRDGV